MPGERKTRLRGAQVLNRSIVKDDLDATGETEGYVATVQADGSVDWAEVSGGGGGSTFKTTFVTGDLISDKITITHNLNTAHPGVIVYNNSDNVVLPTETTYLTDDTIELDFTGMTPLAGTYKVRVFGSTGSTGGFLQAFTNTDLSSGILTASHNLNEQYILVRIYDNNDKIIEPDDYTATDSNTLTVDLTTFGTITGTWNIVISTRGSSGGSGTGDSISDADNDTKIQVEESTDEDIIRFDAGGIQEAQIDINGLSLKSGTSINEFSVDGTLSGDSDGVVPTEKAVKTYADTKASTFTDSFTNTDLSSGILTVTHNLGIKYVNIKIYNNLDKQIMPDDITATSTSVVTIDLNSFGTISGTWNIRGVG